MCRGDYICISKITGEILAHLQTFHELCIQIEYNKKGENDKQCDIAHVPWVKAAKQQTVGTIGKELVQFVIHHVTAFYLD